MIKRVEAGAGDEIKAGIVEAGGRMCKLSDFQNVLACSSQRETLTFGVNPLPSPIY